MNEHRANDPTLTAEELRHLIKFVLAVPRAETGEHLTEEEFAAYAGEEIPPKDLDRIDSHLASCEACAGQLEWSLERASRQVPAVHEPVFSHPAALPQGHLQPRTYKISGRGGTRLAAGAEAAPQFAVTPQPTAYGETALEAEFRQLFERYFQSVLHFFLNRGIPYEDSRDLAQETFLRVYRGISRFRGDASVQTWLFQIARNLCSNQIRRQMARKREGREVSLDSTTERGIQISAERLLVGGSEPTEPLSDLLAEERTRLLREALGSLPPQMRRCVLLRIDHNLKYREIAEVMQIAIDVVKSQLNQARERIEAKLGTYFGIFDLDREED